MLKTAEDRQRLFEEALAGYRHLLEEVARRRADVSARAESLEQDLRELEERETALRERERVLEIAELQLAHQENAMMARAQALQDRERSLTRNPPAPASPSPPGAATLPSASPPRPETGQPRTPEDPGFKLDSTLNPANVSRSKRRYEDRAPTGTPRLDDLLLGGLPSRSHVVLVGDAFVGKEVALYAFIAEGLRRKEPAIVVTAARSAEEVSKGLSLVLPELGGHEDAGRVSWIDASGSGVADAPHKFSTKDSEDTSGLLSALTQATARTGTPPGSGRIRVGFLGLSAVLAHRTEREAFAFLQNVLGILKPYEALAMYALEAGALSDSQVETLLGRMDGAVLFRQTRDRTLMSVKGLGDVATRDWVDCRATEKELLLGSFALERIP